jgi:hypothetical protein
MDKEELEKFLKKVDSLECTEKDFILYWTQIKKLPYEDAKKFYPIHMDEISRIKFDLR